MNYTKIKYLHIIMYRYHSPVRTFNPSRYRHYWHLALSILCVFTFSFVGQTAQRTAGVRAVRTTVIAWDSVMASLATALPAVYQARWGSLVRKVGLPIRKTTTQPCMFSENSKVFNIIRPFPLQRFSLKKTVVEDNDPGPIQYKDVLPI